MQTEDTSKISPDESKAVLAPTSLEAEIMKTCYQLRDQLKDYSDLLEQDSRQKRTPVNTTNNQRLSFDLAVALTLFQSRSEAHVHKLAECLKSFFYSWV